MNVLFVHQNFPAQFKFLAPALVGLGHNVRVLTLGRNHEARANAIDYSYYVPMRMSTRGIHPWLADFETKIIRGESCFRKALELSSAGYKPDVIIAHPGWGESLFLKKVWPGAKLLLYCEFFHNAIGADLGFDPEFGAQSIDLDCRILLKNLNNSLHFDAADAGVSPTLWQANTFPIPFRDKISVIHEGVDTTFIKPRGNAIFKTVTSSGEVIELKPGDPVITFVSRNLEPYRGYHIFMRSLPAILLNNPDAIVLIVGGNKVSYGRRPNLAKSWKDTFLEEISCQLTAKDLKRINFLGTLAYEKYIAMMQISAVHVYLTYPFVLSWSLIEAMSFGLAIVASDTPPVREAIEHNQTGYLVNFFNHNELSMMILELLRNHKERNRLGSNARQQACLRYDLRTKCLPKQIELIEKMLRI